MRRNIRFKPSKEAQTFSRVFSGIFALIGLCFVAIGVAEVIPSGAGLFGLVWTGMAACFVGIGIYGAVSKNGLYGFNRWGLEVEDGEDREETPSAAGEPSESPAAPQTSAEERLKQLEDLREKRLITANEFEEKRKEILKEL